MRVIQTDISYLRGLYNPDFSGFNLPKSTIDKLAQLDQAQGGKTHVFAPILLNQVVDQFKKQLTDRLNNGGLVDHVTAWAGFLSLGQQIVDTFVSANSNQEEEDENQTKKIIVPTIADCEVPNLRVASRNAVTAPEQFRHLASYDNQQKSLANCLGRMGLLYPSDSNLILAMHSPNDANYISGQGELKPTSESFVIALR